jgi:hypothetical protein
MNMPGRRFIWPIIFVLVLLLVGGIVSCMLNRNHKHNVDEICARVTPQIQDKLMSEAKAIFLDLETQPNANEMLYEIKPSIAPTITTLGDSYLRPRSMNGWPRLIVIKVGRHGQGAFINIMEDSAFLKTNPPSTCIVLSSNICVFPE